MGHVGWCTPGCNWGMGSYVLVLFILLATILFGGFLI